MGWMAVVVRFLRYGRNDDGEFNPHSRPRGTRLTGKEGGPLAPGVAFGSARGRYAPGVRG